MPYIEPDGRSSLDQFIDAIEVDEPGELAYVIYRLISNYNLEHEDSFLAKNAVIGVLENCKAEFQKRVLDPYELGKRITNGDIYEHDQEAPGGFSSSDFASIETTSAA